jgi:cytochrome c oxidase assembly protein subunit 15
MMENPELYNLSPLATLLLLGGGLALLPLAWVAWRNRRASSKQRWKSLAALTLFLTFDLVLFGAFTRLTDSGLGCPDWPGCYGSASPLGAKSHIAQAQSALPSGPVTQGKAWIEMVHRYLATGVGALILVLTVVAWRAGRKTDAQAGVSLGLAMFTLFWVCLQGAFGALTVTMKLFPAIVTLHLLGGYVLLALLTVQWVALSPFSVMKGSELSSPLRWGIGLALVWLLIQAASGAWVSTNYAVLACSDFPQCQGSWWPMMDLAQGFELWRPLGYRADGAVLSFQALTAIHMVHRVLAVVTVLVLAGLAWRLSRIEPLRQPAQWLGGLLVLQVSTGLSNVVFDWPLLAAVLHTGGAGALVVVLVFLWAATKPVNAGPKAVYLQAGVAV